MEDESHSRNDCEEAIHKIYHFLDGELTHERRAQIAKHLDDCPPCGAAFEFETELRKVIADHCRDRVPDSLKEKIASIINHEIASDSKL